MNASERGIDHVVVCVADLALAGRIYQRLGFITTPAARHPFGTANALVQLNGNFIELLAVMDPARVPPVQPGRFSFAAFNRDFLAYRQGMSMLVFASDDARRDQAEFAAKGLQTYEPFDFARQAQLADGRTATVAFSLAFVTDARLPRAAFFVCQQHNPENFWQSAYQTHPNSALAISEVIMVAERPALLADLFAKLQSADRLVIAKDHLSVATARGRISVLSPAAFAQRFADATTPVSPASPYFAGFAVTVADLGAAREYLERARFPYRMQDNRLQVDADTALGVVMEFSQSA